MNTVIVIGHLLHSFGRGGMEQVLAKHGTTSGKISISDRGALDYAIEARLEAALQRAGGR